MFLQIHNLTSYHATLLNRDDAGLAKRIPFGDGIRLRVSSQCLKRHWRESLRESLDFPRADQTRKFFSAISDRLIIEHLVPEELGNALSAELRAILISKKSENAEEDEKPSKAAKNVEKTIDLQMDQPVLFGRPEQDYLVSIAIKVARNESNSDWLSAEAAIDRLWIELTGKDKKSQPKKRTEKQKQELKDNFRAMLKQATFAGLEGAIFGRFVTSDILSRSDAPVHVAHAFTVHKLDTEVDYFTAIEELAEQGETGAAHAGDSELGAGLFYGYVAVDIPLLISNLTGSDAKDWKAQDATDARAVLKALIRAIATVSPGAKLGATAPYAFSDFVLLETGPQQPRALANAYLQALPLRGDPMQAAADTLGKHLAALDGMYGKTAASRHASTIKTFDPALAPTLPLDQAIDAALDAVFGA